MRGGVVRRAGDERLGEPARLLEPVILEQHQPEQPVRPLRVACERERGARAVLRGAVEARIGLLPRLADPRLAEGQPRLRRAGLSPEAPLQVADAAVDGGGAPGLPHRQRVTDGEGRLRLLPAPASPTRGGEQDEDSDGDPERRAHGDLSSPLRGGLPVPLIQPLPRQRQERELGQERRVVVVDAVRDGRAQPGEEEGEEDVGHVRLLLVRARQERPAVRERRVGGQVDAEHVAGGRERDARERRPSGCPSG